ncbi:MAG: purine-nucleoside phosphorylase [Vibrio sp.]
MKIRSLIWALSATLTAATSHAHRLDLHQIITPKVMIVTTSSNEARPWLEHTKFTQSVALAGLNPQHPDIYCTDDAVCMVTTAMGYANAATTLMAISFNARLDLSNTYFIIAGIGGIEPKYGTLGSAHWARYVVDGGLLHRIDAQQTPKKWQQTLFALGSDAPDKKPKITAGTEVYHLNEALVNKAYKISQSVTLFDTDQARKARASFPDYSIAAKKPSVSICDTLSSDTFWAGSHIAKAMHKHAALLTHGKAKICTTQMEDNASLTALKRASQAGRLDFNRVLVLRTGANFNQETPTKSALEALTQDKSGYRPATRNAYRVANAVTYHITHHWSQWKNGIK